MKIISFNELRQIKDNLPDGGIGMIAERLNISPETVRNYFGGWDFNNGDSCGIHVESGPDGGIIEIDDTSILDMAIEIIKEFHADEEF